MACPSRTGGWQHSQNGTPGQGCQRRVTGTREEEGLPLGRGNVRLGSGSRKAPGGG